MTPTAIKIITFYKNLTTPSWQDSHVFGSFPVTTANTDFIAEFHDALDMEIENHQGLVILPEEMSQYQNLQVKFLPPRNQSFFFAEGFKDYLENFDFMQNPAKEFYISDIDGYCYENEAQNKAVKSYLCLIELIKLLSRIADHVDTNNNQSKLIFLSPISKEEIILKYSGEIFITEDITHTIENINEEIFSLPHSKTKISLFKKSVTSFTQGINGETKLSYIFKNIHDIEKTFNNNYELFLNEFSFENEKEKLEEKKQSYLLKINEVLSGIHGKLFAVPASVIIVAGQMKPETEVGFEVIDSIIIAGAFVFALFMWMLTANQLHSLEAIRIDYKNKKDRLKIELRESLFNDLNSAFLELDRRFKYQRAMIFSIDIIVLLGFLFSLFVFEFHTKIIAHAITQ